MHVCSEENRRRCLYDGKMQSPRGSEGRRASRITMADIAAAADADVSTVSRTLGRERDSIRTQKGRRIWEIADELGYSPNLTASSLRTNTTRLIAVFVPRLRDEVLALMYEGIEEELQGQGYQCMVLSTGDDPEVQLAKLDVAIQRGVDGILFGDAMVGSQVLSKVEKAGIPYLLFNRPLEGHRSVTCDDFHGGVLAAEHLMELTDGPLVVYRAMDYAENLVNRSEGFIRTVREQGRTPIDGFHLNGGIYAEDGILAAREMIAECDAPFGAFVVNDTAGIGALGEFSRSGLIPGSDVFVVGFNDISLAKATPIALSTIVSPTRELGHLAASSLLTIIGGGDPESVQLPVELVVRESSVPLANQP